MWPDGGHRRANSGAVAKPRPPQPMLDRRRVWLGEEQPGQIEKPVPGGACAGLVAREQPIAHQREAGGLDMCRGENAAISALYQRAVEERVLAGEHGEALRPAAHEFKGLNRIAATILDADDIDVL